MADHHVRARQRLQLRVDDRRHLLVADRGAGVGQIGERRQPQRRPKAIDALGGKARQLPPRLPLHAQLGQDGDEPGTPRPLPVDLAGEDPDRRRHLGQPPLLAANAEHLDAVVPDASRPVSSRPHSCERSAIASASARFPSQRAIAEP